jgi:retrograde regulation protein 2
VAALIGDAYPAGRVPNNESRVNFRTSWEHVFKKKQGPTDALHLKIVVNESVSQAVTHESLQDTIERIEKIGKKKNWIKAEDRIGSERTAGDYGVSIEVELSSR